MKRVYVIFESRYDSWIEPRTSDEWWEYSSRNYEDKFVDVYDNYQAAHESIRNWAKYMDSVMNRKSGKSSEELTILATESPYSNEDTITIKREIKSVLLKSS